MERRDAARQIGYVVLPQKEIVVVELYGVNRKFALHVRQNVRGAFGRFRFLPAVRDLRDAAKLAAERDSRNWRDARPCACPRNVWAMYFSGLRRRW